MSQLLMKWVCKNVEVPAVPQGFKLHQYHRKGDSVLSEEDYERGWIASVVDIGAYTHDAFKDYYNDEKIPDDGFFVILDEKNNVVSTTSVILGARTPDSATLHMVGTARTHRGMGLGKITTLAAMDYIQKRKIETAYLTTDDFRIPAVKIYLKYGFLPVLYEPDMRERWLKLMDTLNLSELKAFDEKGALTDLK